jgi:hypothetical protein
VKYDKPSISCPTEALVAIQGMPKQVVTTPDSQFVQNRLTVAAYEADE